jgi:hypothetical protein
MASESQDGLQLGESVADGNHVFGACNWHLISGWIATSVPAGVEVGGTALQLALSLGMDHNTPSSSGKTDP